MLGLEYGDQPSDVKQYVGHASEYITELLVSYFDSNNLAYDLTDFSGRSDYGPFLDFGIPAGGLDTGADGIKTEDERHRFGGMVGIQHDPCYHLHCDTIENLSQEALRDMSAAASYGLERLLAAPALGAWLDASTHNEQQLPAAFTQATQVVEQPACDTTVELRSVGGGTTTCTAEANPNPSVGVGFMYYGVFPDCE